MRKETLLKVFEHAIAIAVLVIASVAIPIIFTSIKIMNTHDILKELMEKPKEEIEYSLFILMLKDKLDFITLSNMYVQSLNAIKEDRLNLLIEAETCILESFFDKKVKAGCKGDNKHTQRCLYLLNQSRRFQMQDMNNKYGYNEEKAKELSWYERNKERIR